MSTSTGDEKAALAAVHRAMVVLREELDIKNRIIMKLRKQMKTRLSRLSSGGGQQAHNANTGEYLVSIYVSR